MFTYTEKAVKIRTTLGINFIKGYRKSQAGPNEDSNTRSFKVRPLISLTLFCLPTFRKNREDIRKKEVKQELVFKRKKKRKTDPPSHPREWG